MRPPEDRSGDTALLRPEINPDLAPLHQRLRALYFALAAMIHRFKYLTYALAAVLVFIGLKIFSVGLIGKTPPALSLGVTFGLIAAGVAYSLWRTRTTANPSTLPAATVKP